MVISCSYFGCTNRQTTAYKRKKKKINQTKCDSETDTASEVERMEEDDNCRKNTEQSQIRVTFHRFPKDPDRRKMWALAVNQKGPDGKL